MNKLNVKALMLAFGISWALFILFIGWSGALGWGKEITEVIASLYIGFGPSFVGGLIGAVWGFVDGLIWGLLIGIIYNKISAGKKTQSTA
ncbi:MAG: bacteriophage holin [Elusimicrobiota bacterium]